MKTLLFRSLVLLLASCFLSLVWAEDAGAVKDRMEQRLAQVDALKEKGVVGENNQGLLEIRGAAGDAAAIVDAENNDRLSIYAAVARKTGSTADQVGRKRAARIAQYSRSGVWVQDESGSWRQK